MDNDVLGDHIRRLCNDPIHVGSLLTDAWGKLMEHIEHTGSTAQPYQFVGELGYHTHWQDTYLGFLQLGVRFYIPGPSRFMQADPEHMDFSPYLYASGDPTRLVDPAGRSAKIPDLPKGWKDCITKAWEAHCPKDKVSSKLLRCIIYCESKDDPEALNPNGGAAGLFQIRPEWWDPSDPIYCKHKKWKNRCQDKTPSGEDFEMKDPCDNIMCGVWLFCNVHHGDPKEFGTTRPKAGKKCLEDCMSKYVW